MDRLYIFMKPQDEYPYDSPIAGLNNTFHTVGRNSFYFNSNCVLATDKIVTIGKEYIIFDNTTETGIKMSDVILIDCCYREGYINLIVRDLKSKRVFTIHYCIECPQNYCTWVLIDLNFFIDKMNIKAIQSYCTGCKDPKRKPNAEISNGSNRDDLLEFDY